MHLFLVASCYWSARAHSELKGPFSRRSLESNRACVPASANQILPQALVHWWQQNRKLLPVAVQSVQSKATHRNVISRHSPLILRVSLPQVGALSNFFVVTTYKSTAVAPPLPPPVKHGRCVPDTSRAHNKYVRTHSGMKLRLPVSEYTCVMYLFY